jgi:hypothetical protein
MTRPSVLAFVLLLAASAAHAQSAGAALAGIVSDDSGARLPGVTLTITNLANGEVERLTTGDGGAYRAMALPPASYRVEATLTGFAPLARDVVLNVGDEITLHFRLAVAGVAERVIVAPRPLAVSTHQPAAVVTAEQIESLPELGRSFLVLAQLLPGSAPLNSSVTRFATTRFGGAADQRSAVTTLIDGGDVDDAQWGTPTINLSQDSVQEFKVFRYQFDAEYGDALSAVVSVVTKSGASRLAGSAFYFGRDEALNARNEFARAKPPFDEQRFGASAGGPVPRGRAHAFALYESNHVDTVRLIAHPAGSPFAGENGVFPADSTDRLLTAKLDRRFGAAHNSFVRYAYAQQRSDRLQEFPTSDSSQIDTFSRAHSIVAEDAWSVSSRLLNSARAHWFAHRSGGAPHHAVRDAAVARPSINRGLVNGGEWLDFPRREMALADTLYFSAGPHTAKVGGEVSFGRNQLEGHFFEDGLFRFQTDAVFDPAVRATWPISFVQQRPSTTTYRARQLALFVQDDWRAAARLHLNVGLRYDLDPTLRLADDYTRALDDPALRGLGTFVGSDRGTDANNVQPRVGATYDARGDGTVIVRGGWGVYVARNRPWLQVRALNQLAGPALRIEDANQLRLYPDVGAVTAAGGVRELGTVIADDFEQSSAANTTAGVGWQAGRQTTVDVDYVHSRGVHQYGTTDRNLPPSGAISAANPRPVPQFGQVAMLENFSRSWYDALETQVRTRFGRDGWLRASYALSRTWLDGVDFFLTQRGTQRTPRESGYSPSDQRHNLTLAGGIVLPAQIELTGILKLISGSPMPVQTGTDLDGDRSQSGDRPPGLPITIGRGDTRGAIDLVNAFRASLATPLPPVDAALVRLDPYRTLDLRLARSWRAGGRRRIELVIEGYNVLNAVNYVPSAVNRNIVSAQFLARTSARDARQLQWGTRVRF